MVDQFTVWNTETPGVDIVLEMGDEILVRLSCRDPAPGPGLILSGLQVLQRSSGPSIEMAMCRDASVSTEINKQSL